MSTFFQGPDTMNSNTDTTDTPNSSNNSNNSMFEPERMLKILDIKGHFLNGELVLDGEEKPVDRNYWTAYNSRIKPDPSKMSEIQYYYYKRLMDAKPTFNAGDMNFTSNDALKELAERNNMPVIQENGQRRYGPPRDYTGPEPGKGCEIFIGKLPRDCYEQDIVPLVEKIGKIYDLRLMMDFSGTNRGYCFVKFFESEDAQRALAELNDYEIRPGRKIGILPSVDNCRLFLGGIPKDKTEDDIFKEISKITDGVKSVISYPSILDKTKNRGFAFIEYNCHKSAAMARRKMLPRKIPMWGLNLMVDWAEPLPDVEKSIMEKVTNLYVRNLLVSTTEEYLMELFNKHSENGVERVKKIKDFAFVHFFSREQANMAKISLDKTNIDGSRVEILWAKPIDDRENYRMKKALSKSMTGFRNFQGPQQSYGYNRQPLFGSYGGSNSSNHRFSNNLPLPIPIHNNEPMITGMGSFDQQLAALESSFASQKFFSPTRGQQRESGRGRAAAGIQSFHLNESTNQQAQRAKMMSYSANGYVPGPCMYGMHNWFYQPQMYEHQHELPEMQHFGHQMQYNGY